MRYCIFRDWDSWLKERFLEMDYLYLKKSVLCLWMCRHKRKTQNAILHLSGDTYRIKIKLVYFFDFIFEYLFVSFFPPTHINSENWEVLVWRVFPIFQMAVSAILKMVGNKKLSDLRSIQPKNTPSIVKNDRNFQFFYQTNQWVKKTTHPESIAFVCMPTLWKRHGIFKIVMEIL